MFDFDLATLYEVETKVLNQAIKRNIDSFPGDFMFKLTKEEYQFLRSQIVTTLVQSDDNQQTNRSQFVTGSQKHRSKDYLPYAFTEHGVTMLASVLKSPKARQMNIAIVRAFIALKQFALNYGELAGQLAELKHKVGDHDTRLNEIYTAIETLLADKKNEKSWEDRNRIGFIK